MDPGNNGSGPEEAARGILPLLVRHFRDIAGVNLGVWTGCQRPEVGPLLPGQRRQGLQSVANHLLLRTHGMV
jgi:hypothetical protein